MKSAQITNDDVLKFADDLFFFGDKTEQVLDDRISKPLPGHVVEIAIDRLAPDPEQPRKTFKPETLKELADSIKVEGLLQPLVVRPGEHGRYIIVAGERRYRAAPLAGLETVPCTVRNCTAEQALVLALMENLHRDDLTDMEKSDALVHLKKITRKTWTELSDVVCLSPDRVRSLAGLQTLAEPVQEMVRAGDLSGRKAIAIKPLPAEAQIPMLTQAVEEKWTAEEIRTRVQEQLGKPPTKRRQTSRDNHTQHVTRNMPFLVPMASETLTEHVTRNMPSRDLRTAPSLEIPHIPALVARCRAAVQETLQLLHSLGEGAIEPAFASEFWSELEELQGLLGGTVHQKTGFGNRDKSNIDESELLPDSEIETSSAFGNRDKWLDSESGQDEPVTAV